MSRKIYWLTPLFSLCFACSAGTASNPAQSSVIVEEQHINGVHRGPAVDSLSLLELVPIEASGAALVHVARLRESTYGSALTNMVRRVGAFEWEGAIGVDLRTEVERLLVFGVTTEGQAPGDLSGVIDVIRQIGLGAIIELRPSMVDGDGLCLEADLAELVGRPLPEPAVGMVEYRCGRFVIVRRADLGDAIGSYRNSPLIGVLSDLEEMGQLTAETVFFAVASPEMVDRVSCNDVTIALRSWQVATIQLGDGMTLRGRYHAADAEQVAQLEQCVSDGMGGFSDVPLFAQLELRDVLQNATVQQDVQSPGDVLLEASFTEGELDLMLGLLELVGSGIQ